MPPIRKHATNDARCDGRYEFNVAIAYQATGVVKPSLNAALSHGMCKVKTASGMPRARKLGLGFFLQAAKPSASDVPNIEAIGIMRLVFAAAAECSGLLQMGDPPSDSITTC